MAEENGIVFISDDRDDPESFVPISRENLEKLHVQMIGFDQAKSDKGFFTVSFPRTEKTLNKGLLQFRENRSNKVSFRKSLICHFFITGQIRDFLAKVR